MEAGVVVDHQGQPLYWHLPRGRTVASLPECPELWDVLWSHRHEIAGFAHSHPGVGPSGPSHVDVTTFAAIEAGLGRRLDWWIMTEDRVSLFRWEGPSRFHYAARPVREEPPWVGELRRISTRIEERRPT